MIRDSIVVTVVDVRGDKIRLGIEARKDVPDHRREVYEAIKRYEGSQTKSPDISIPSESVLLNHAASCQDRNGLKKQTLATITHRPRRGRSKK